MVFKRKPRSERDSIEFTKYDEPDYERPNLSWEVALLLLTALVFSALAWVFLKGQPDENKANAHEVVEFNWKRLFGGSEQQTSLIDKPQRVNELWEKANFFLARDRLTSPPEDNALEVILEIQEIAPSSDKAVKGLQRISERYMQMIDRLISERDKTLLEATLISARKLVPHVQKTEYEAALEAGRKALVEMELNAVNRAKNVKRADYSAFQDKLADGTSGPVMIYLPAGSFMMGSPSDEFARDVDEGVQREIAVNAFAISKAEVSFAEYERFARAIGKPLPSDNGWGFGERPAINVSWHEAREYALWLGRQTGHRYRLPTEAEWEYAARAGTRGPCVFGQCLSSEQVNISGQDSIPNCEPIDTNRAKTLPVRTLQTNPWGLYHVHGNVREWVEDCWLGNLEYPSAKPLYIAEGGGCGVAGHKRVVRGGSWSSTQRSSRISNRFAIGESERSSEVGIRLARDI